MLTSKRTAFALRITALVMTFGLPFVAAEACGGKSPKPVPTKSPTDEDGREIEQPIPTGCKGKIISRIHDPNSKTFAITYNDAKCRPSGLGIITEEEDLNMTCTEGDYYPICRTPDQTEPPGIRMPTDPAS